MLIVLTVGCTNTVIKTLYLPYDYTLDKKVQKRWGEIKKGEVSQSKIVDQLNDLDTLNNKSRMVITQNNKGA